MVQTHFVCVQCVYVELLCGPLPRPLTSYATWQVTNSFLIACTKIISLFPFLGGTGQDVCAIIIASVRFPVCYFWSEYFKGRLCICLWMCVRIVRLCDCLCAYVQLCKCVNVHTPSKGGLNGPEVLFLGCERGECVCQPCSCLMRVFLIAVAIPWERAVCLCVCAFFCLRVCVPLCLADSGLGHCAIVHYSSNPPTQWPARWSRPVYGATCKLQLLLVGIVLSAEI